MTYNANRKIPQGQELTNSVTAAKLAEALRRIQALEAQIKDLILAINDINETLQEVATVAQRTDARGTIYGN